MQDNAAEKKDLFDGQVVTDSLNRKIVLKKPKITDRYYLYRALGLDANNQMCVGTMASLLFVKSVDGVVINRPMNLAECLAGLERIGEEGNTAIEEYVLAEMAKDPKEAIESVKK